MTLPSGVCRVIRGAKQSRTFSSTSSGSMIGREVSLNVSFVSGVIPMDVRTNENGLRRA